MKSFSVITKEELCKLDIKNTEEAEAELAGLLLFGAMAGIRGKLKLSTENADVFERYRQLCQRLSIDEGELLSDNSARFSVVTDESVLTGYRLTDEETGVSRFGLPVSITEDAECRRAFIRGAFLGGGTIIDPNKNYNLEIVTPYMGLSVDFDDTLKKSGFEFRRISRKSKYVLYVKRSEEILDFLTYIGAYKAQMELINIKIEKELRNDFNRSANGETANIVKTINASVKQTRAIELVQEKCGLDDLPEELRELAELRIKYKSESLSKLGEMLNPPLKKSGVNHRFNRIIAIAERLEKP